MSSKSTRTIEEGEEGGVACGSNSNKKPRVEKDVEVEDTRTSAHQVFSLMLSEQELLKLLVKSGFSTAEELERMVLGLSKNFVETSSPTTPAADEKASSTAAAAFATAAPTAPISSTSSSSSPRDALYYILCCNRWGDEHARNLVDGMGIGAERCFWKLVLKEDEKHGEVKYHFPGTKPLKYAPKDYLIIVKVLDKSKKVTVTQVIKGDTVPEFFETGDISIEFDCDPVVVYRAEGRLDRPRLQRLDRHYREPKVDLSAFDNIAVHLMRLPDQKCVQVMSCTDAYAAWIDEDRYRIGLSGDNIERFIPLANPYAESLIYELFGSRWNPDIPLELESYLTYRPTTTNAHHDTISVSGLRMYLIYWTDNEATEARAPSQGGVTFAHLLEEMAIWGDEE